MSSKRFLCFVLLFAFCSCRFKAPNIAEQKYLMEKGAFPGGVPDWVAQPTGADRVGASGGLIPQTFSQASREQQNPGVLTAKQSTSSAGTYAAPDALKDKKETQTEELQPKTPLHRISKLCPNIEKETNTALITTDVRQRIRAYESLVTRCPDSWDLWLWLGKDYSKSQQLVKAGRCFEKVLVLNPTNEEAQQLAAENRKKLNNPKASGSKKKSATSGSSE